MHLGLNCDKPSAEEWRYIDDLGVTWIKIYCALDNESAVEKLAKAAEPALQRELKVVVDLRVELNELSPYHQTVNDKLVRESTNRALEGAGYEGRAIDEFWHAEEQYGLNRLWQWALAAWEGRCGEAAVDRPTIIQEICSKSWRGAMEYVGETTCKLAEHFAGSIDDWEIMGEFTCPVVMRDAFSDYDYTLHLATSYQAIKEANPQARVWTGGSGIQLGIAWLQSILDPLDDAIFPTGGPPGVPQKPARPPQVWFPEGLGSYFDVVNWHHYGHTTEQFDQVNGLSLEGQIEAYNSLFTKARLSMKRAGCSQPFASTEWGFPVVDDRDLPPGEENFNYSSNLYWGGVSAIRQSRSAEWMRRSLECFEGWGFEVLCIHNLRDINPLARAQAYFWGNRCGLLDLYWNKWPTYKVVQEFAWKARESGRPAFEGAVQ